MKEDRPAFAVRLRGVVRTVVVEAQAGQVVKAELQFADGSGAGTGVPPTEDGGTRSSWSTARIVTVAGLGAVAVAGGVLAIVFHSNAQGNVDDAKDLLKGGSCVGRQATTGLDDGERGAALSSFAFSCFRSDTRCRLSGRWSRNSTNQAPAPPKDALPSAIRQCRMCGIITTTKASCISVLVLCRAREECLSRKAVA